MFGFERGNDWRQDDQMRWQFSMLQRHIYSVRTATRVFCVCPAHRPSHPTLQTSSTWPPLRGRRRTCVAVPVWDRTCKPFFGTCIVNKIHVIFTFLCVCTSFNPLLFNPLLQISYNLLAQALLRFVPHIQQLDMESHSTGPQLTVPIAGLLDGLGIGGW